MYYNLGLKSKITKTRSSWIWIGQGKYKGGKKPNFRAIVIPLKILAYCYIKNTKWIKARQYWVFTQASFVFHCCLLRSEWESTARHANDTSHSRAGSQAFQTESLHKPFGKKLKVTSSMTSSCLLLLSSAFPPTQFLDLLVCQVKGFFLPYKKTHTPINRINTRCIGIRFNTHLCWVAHL